MQWQNGRRGQDGWGRYTRRRKWYRDAELVEITASTEITPSPTPTPTHSSRPSLDSKRSPGETGQSALSNNDAAADDDSSTKSSGFRSGTLKRSSASGRESLSSPDEDEVLPGHIPHLDRDGDWGIGDDARMGLE